MSSVKWRPFCLDLNVLNKSDAPNLTLKDELQGVFYFKLPRATESAL